jgi:uncharacterized protein (TIGR03435 family)
MVFEDGKPKKRFGQFESRDAVGDDLDGLLRNCGADDLTKQIQSSSNWLGDRRDVGIDRFARGPASFHPIAGTHLFHANHGTAETGLIQVGFRPATGRTTKFRMTTYQNHSYDGRSDFGQVFVCLAGMLGGQRTEHPESLRMRISEGQRMSGGSIAAMATKPAVLMLRFLGTLLLATVGSTSLAQTSTPATALPAFEVAAIKLNQSGSGSSHSDTNNGRFTATNVSLKNVMEYSAYGIPGNRILGGPKWLDSTRFDIDAKMDDSVAEHLRTLAHGPRRLETQAMFQQLLADRFKLAVHWETRELSVYALTVAKKGPKLQPTKETTEGSGTSSHNSGSGSELSAKGVTLPELAQALTQELSRELGRDVIDQTEIKGRYNLTLKWTQDAGADDAAPSADSGPSVFTAVQEQLGLKLEPAKAPVRVLVIDRAEMPSEN